MRFTQLMRIRCKLPDFSAAKQQYVPKHQPVLEEDVKKLQEFLLDKPNIVVLTGAGISTESGNCVYTLRTIKSSKYFPILLKVYPIIVLRV